ncbi:MAG: 30S ribosomal protein S16 [Cyanobium sp.]
MIKLRLKRFGKKREASFRLVATNSTSRRDGRPLEELGFYNPRTKETRLNTEAIRSRLSQGAQPTDTVRSLLEKGGLLEKTIRPAETVGKAKQAAAREAAAKEAAAKAAAEKAAAQEAEAAASSEG